MTGKVNANGRLTTFTELLDQVALAVTRRPGRAVLAGAGSLVGLALVGYALVFSASAAGAVVAELDSLAATSVNVVAANSNAALDANDTALEQLGDLSGVIAVGEIATVGSRSVNLNPAPWSTDRQDLPVIGVSAGATTYLELQIDGSGIGPAAHRLGFNQAILGIGAADQFGDAVAVGSYISIDGLTFEVAGIALDAEQRPEVLFQVIIPAATAERLWAVDATRSEVVIRTEPGAAGFVASHADLILSPDSPADVITLYEPEPEQFRTRLTGHLDSFTIGLAVAMVALSIAITAATAATDVVARRQEIGLRRSLGATRRDIAIQFLGESSLMNFTSGTVGIVVGIVIGTVVAVQRGWTPVIPPWVVIIGPLVGLLAGMTGGTVPARRASTTDPVTALRQL